MSRAERVFGIQRTPDGRDRLRRARTIEMMPGKTTGDLARLLGCRESEVVEICKKLGDPRGIV